MIERQARSRNEIVGKETRIANGMDNCGREGVGAPQEGLTWRFMQKGEQGVNTRKARGSKAKGAEASGMCVMREGRMGSNQKSARTEGGVVRN